MFKIDMPTVRNIITTASLHGDAALKSLRLVDPGDGILKPLIHDFFIHIDLGSPLRDEVIHQIINLINILKRIDNTFNISKTSEQIMLSIITAIQTKKICVPIKIPLGDQDDQYSITIVLYDSTKNPELLFAPHNPLEVCSYTPVSVIANNQLLDMAASTAPTGNQNTVLQNQNLTTATVETTTPTVDSATTSADPTPIPVAKVRTSSNNNIFLIMVLGITAFFIGLITVIALLSFNRRVSAN